jgi:hypothetical protein
LIKIRGRVVICERKVSLLASVETGATSILDWERMRIYVSSSMVVEIRPFDGFVVIKVGEAFPSEFPNEECNDTDDGYAASDR